MSKDETVQLKSPVKKTRRLRMAYNLNNGNRVAAIRCSGQYLESLGFRHDGFFEMTINEDNSITIRPVKAEDESAPSQAE